jgi:heme-degrading monooxygenase HmoA
VIEFIQRRKEFIVVQVIVRHKVQDYTKWYAMYTGHASTRKTGGSKGARLFRNADNPNELVILFEWENLEKARQFVQSEDLRKIMEKAGVVDKPDSYFLQEIERTKE